MLGGGALGRPRGMVWGGRWERGSGWGTCVYLWQIHVDIWQNQYNIIKLKNKIKKIKGAKKLFPPCSFLSREMFKHLMKGKNSKIDLNILFT